MKSCVNSLANTGIACTPLMGVANNVIIVPLYGSNGELNNIDVTAIAAGGTNFWTDLINAPDKEDRWYPVPAMKSIEDVKGDPIYEDFPDLTKVFITQGVRSFKGLIVGDISSPQLLGKLNAFRNTQLGVYVVTKTKQLVGKQIDGVKSKLYPISIESSTLNATFVKTQDKSSQKIMLSFDFGILEDDKDLRLLELSELGYDLTTLDGLIDVIVEYSNKTATGVTITLTTAFGTMLSPVVVEGLLQAAFSLYDVTDASLITISTFTESAPGVYDITYASAGTDVIQPTITEDGYDFSTAGTYHA